MEPLYKRDYGHKKKKWNFKDVYYIPIIIVILLLAIWHDSKKIHNKSEESYKYSKEIHDKSKESYKNWYEGGNLHHANALTWQRANYDNKLATCADFIAKLWKSKLLKQEILSRVKNPPAKQVALG